MPKKNDKTSNKANKEALDEQVKAKQESNETQQTDLDNDLQKELEEARQSTKDNWNQVLRVNAEMENLKKRNMRDLENAHKYALEKFVKELLTVKDSLTIALDMAGKEDVNVKSMQEGMTMINKTFISTLEKFDVKEINPMNQKFDPEYHEAMTVINVPDKESQAIVDVIQVGITLNGRLIRPARVIVAE